MASMGETATFTILGVDALSGPAGAASASLGALGKAGDAAGKVVAAAFTAAAAAATAMAAGVALGVKSAGDLEQAVANISTIKPEIDTSAVFAQLNEMSTRIPQTAAELGDSLYDIFSSVNVTQEEGLKLLEQFGRGAVGAQTDAKTFGTAVMGVMNAYGLSVDQASHVSDVFFNTVNKGVVTGEELASSLGLVTQAAKMAGADVNELGGMIAGVTKEGGPAAQNINNLNNLLLKMGTKEAAAGFKDLGINIANADGTMRPVMDVLGDLKTATAGMTEEAKLLAIQKIFPDIQARAGATVLMSQLDFVKAAIEENITASGSASAAFEKMNATFNSQMKILQNTFMSILTTIGAKLLPIITPMITAFSKWLPEAFDTALKALEPLAPMFIAVGETIASLAKYIGVVVMEGDDMNDWLTHIPPALQPIVAGIGKVIVVLRDLGKYIGAVIEDGDTMNDWLTHLPAPLQKVIQGFAAFGSAVMAAVPKIINVVKELTPVVIGLAGAVLERLGKAFTFIVDVVVPPMLSIVKQVATFFMETLLPAIDSVAATMQGQLGITLNWLSTTVLPAFLSIAQQTIGFFVETILPTLPSVAANLRTLLGETIVWLSDTVWPALRVAATVAWEFISGTIIPAIPPLAALLRTTLGAAIQWVGETGWPMLVKGATIAWEFLDTKVIPVVREVIEWLKVKLPQAIATVTTAWESIKDKIAPIIEAVFAGDIKTAISKLGTAFSEFATLAIGWLGEQVAKIKWGEVWAKAVEIGSALGTWVATQVVDFATWLGDQISKIDWAALWQQTKDVAGALGTYLYGLAVDFATWLGQRISEIDWAALWIQTKDLAKALSDYVVTQTLDFATWLKQEVALIPWPQVWAAIVGITEAAQAEFTARMGQIQWFEVMGATAKMEAEVLKWLTQVINQTDWANIGNTFGTNLGTMMVNGTNQTDWGTVGNNFAERFNAMIGLAMALPAAWYAFNEGFLNGIVTAITGMKPDEAARAFAQWLIQAFTLGAAEFGRSAGKIIADALPKDPLGLGSVGANQTKKLSTGGGGSDDFNEYLKQAALAQGLDPAQVLAVMGKEGPTGWTSKGTFPTGTSYGPLQLHYAGGVDPKAGMGDRFTKQTGIDLRTVDPTTPAGIAAHKAAVDFAMGELSRAGNFGEWYGADNAFPMLPSGKTGRFTPVNRVPIQPMPGGMVGPGNDPGGMTDFMSTQRQWAQDASYAGGVCGPRLAALFTDAVGRPPTPEEAVSLAEGMGLFNRGNPIFQNASQFDEYATALIQQTNPGSPYSVNQVAATGAAAGALGVAGLQGGSPLVGFNTGQHYYGADQYNAETGQFHVGGTGISGGGKEWMTIAEIEKISGAITGVMTLVDKSGQSFQMLGAQAAASGQATAGMAGPLAEIGGALDPVVALFDQGVVSASGLTDAIIAQSASQGIGAATADQYSQGLISQDAALRGVLEGFAATTPAAAELLAQLDAGTISTEQAAISFAGLATSTATAQGAIGAMAMGMGESMTGLSLVTTEQMTAMGLTVTEQANLMATGVTTSVGLMGETVTTTVDGMGTLVQTSVDTMGTTVTTSINTMGTVVTTTTDSMGNVVEERVDQMYSTVTDSFEEMQDESTTAAEDMNTDVVSEADSMHQDSAQAAVDMALEVIAEAQKMQQDAILAAQAMSTGVGQGFSEMASSADGTMSGFVGDTEEKFDSVGTAADEAVTAIEAIGEVDIPAPDISDVIEAMQDIEEAAHDAIEEAEEASHAGDDDDDDDDRHSGGHVSAGVPYLIGKHGAEEIFIPHTAGYVMPMGSYRPPQMSLAGFGGGGSGGVETHRIQFMINNVMAAEIVATGRDVLIQRGTLAPGRGAL